VQHPFRHRSAFSTGFSTVTSLAGKSLQATRLAREGINQQSAVVVVFPEGLEAYLGVTYANP